MRLTIASLLLASSVAHAGVTAPIRSLVPHPSLEFRILLNKLDGIGEVCPAVSPPSSCPNDSELDPTLLLIMWDTRNELKPCPEGFYRPFACRDEHQDVLHACLCNAWQNYVNTMCECTTAECEIAARWALDAALQSCNGEYHTNINQCCTATH